MFSRIIIFILLVQFPIILYSQKEPSIYNSALPKIQDYQISLTPYTINEKYKVENLFQIFGNDKSSDGESVSYGLSIVLKKRLLSNFFIIGGLGYLKKIFDFSSARIPANGSYRITNSRPFDYITLDRIALSTDYYIYYNGVISVGAEYKFNAIRKWNLNIGAEYQQLISFKEKYYVELGGYPPEKNRYTYNFSKMILLNPGIEYCLNSKLSFELFPLIPLLVLNKKDKIFREDPNESYAPMRSLGIGFSINKNL